MIYRTNEGKEIQFSPPKDISGLLPEAPKSPRRMLPGAYSLNYQVTHGLIPSIVAGVEVTHGSTLQAQIKKRLRKEQEVAGQTGGESNRRLPERANFAAGPGRGDEYLHIPTKTRVVVMQPHVGKSKSGKSMVRVATRDGDAYNVPLDSLSPL